MSDKLDRPAMKTCTKCQKEKPASEFYRKKRSKDGFHPWCKTCDSKQSAAYHARNREQIIERHRADYANNRERFAAHNRDRRISDPRREKAKNLVGTAKRNGTLVVGPCEECGTTKNVHAHHDDYDKPMDVRWLCRSHHQRFHAASTRAAAEAALEQAGEGE